MMVLGSASSQPTSSPAAQPSRFVAAQQGRDPQAVGEAGSSALDMLENQTFAYVTSLNWQKSGNHKGLGPRTQAPLERSPPPAPGTIRSLVLPAYLS